MTGTAQSHHKPYHLASQEHADMSLYVYGSVGQKEGVNACALLVEMIAARAGVSTERQGCKKHLE